MTSFGSFTNLIPRPPPPAEALSITGYPIAFALSNASSGPSNIPSPPGTTGTPASFIVCFAFALFPIESMMSGLGPRKAKPFSLQIFENCALSDRNPYPG